MPTRKWGPERLVNTTTINGQQSSHVAVLANGTFVVVWEDDSGAHTAIRAQRFDAAGNPLGGEIAIATSTGNDQVLPSVTALADGGFYVTWTQLVGPDNYIFGSVYDAGGAFIRPQTVVFAFGQDTNSEAARLGTGSAVVWEDPDANNIDFRVFDAAGNGSAVLVANATGVGFAPSLATSPNQTTLAIAWVDQGLSIQGRLFDAAGNQFAPQFRIDAPASSLGVFDPHVTWLNNDQFVVVWRQSNSFNAAGNEIIARIFDGQTATPVALTGNIAVNSTIFESQQNPTLTALPNGGFVVAWEDISGIGVDSDFAIRLQAFDGAGNKIGGEIVVNTTTTGEQFQPSISALPDSRVVVTWTDQSQTGGDTSSAAIRMQIIDPRDGIVTGTPASETLYGHDLVNDEISAGSGNDILFGLRGDDALYGGDGNDVLNGGIGADMMYGGLGNDSYYVDNVDDVVTENLHEGTDTVYASVNYALQVGQEVEFLRANAGATGLVLTGNELNDYIVGLGGNDTLNGNDGNDALAGGAGNDMLNGGNGNDVLNGQAGADLMSGGAGNDTYYVDNAVDKVFEAVGGGSDTVFAYVNYALQAGQEVEFLRANAGATGLTLTGNEFANTIVGLTGNDALNGGDGNDTLNGGDGNDALAGGNGNDTINGGNGDDISNGQAGADLMSGGAGNDTYYVDNAVDKVFEAVGGGSDTVFAYVNYALQAGQEVEALRGFAGATGLILTGNEFNNLLVGLTGDDTLNGGNGNDTLNGGNGNDVLNGMFGIDLMAGGAGNDTFAWNAPTEGGDNITDFKVSGADVLRFNAAAFGFAPGHALVNGSEFIANNSPVSNHAGPTFLMNTSLHNLSFDADGTGAGAAVLISHLNADAVASDLHLV